MPIPNEASCPRCGWFDPTHDDVKELAKHPRYANVELGCRCIPQHRADQPSMRTFGPNAVYHEGHYYDRTTGERLD